MNSRHTRPTLPSRPGRRFRDVASLLPITGILLLVTPLMVVFTQSPRFLGLPSPFVYVFSIWGGLIILAFCLARRALKDSDPR